MASLLSVLLVASSASGSRLLFSYPPNPAATPRVQRPLYGKSASAHGVRPTKLSVSDDDDDEEETELSSTSSEEDVFGSRFIRGESSSSSSSEDEDDLQDEYDTRELRERDSYKVHLGLDTDVLGDLLCPRRALCNQRFEMVINHLAFIAHPASASKAPRAANGSRYARSHNDSPFLSEDEEDGNHTLQRRRDKHKAGSGGQTTLTQSEDRGRSAPASAFSSRRTSRSMPNRPSNIKTSRESSRSRGQAGPFEGNNHPMLPHTNSSASDPLQQKHSLRTKLSGHSNLAMSMSNVSDTLSGLASTPSGPLPSAVSSAASANSPSELESWAIVLVIDSPPEQHLSYHLGIYYRDVIVPLMAALKYEERKGSYVRAEAAKIASFREKSMESGTPFTTHIEALCEESGLCEQLAKLYNDLKREGLANLTFNDDIDMSVLLHAELFRETALDIQARDPISRALPSHRTGHKVSEISRQALSLKQRQATTAYETRRLDLARLTTQVTGGLLEGRAIHVDIAPWQALLPLQDVGDLLQQLDGESLLTRFLEIMSPTLTFHEYETLLDADSHSIIEIAEHLIYWRKARLTDAVTLKSIYAPARPANSGPVQSLAVYAAEFAAAYPELQSLPSIYASLYYPQPFDSLLAPGHKLRSTYLDCLAWLMRHRLLRQMRMFINLVATPEIKRAAYEKEEAKQHTKTGSDISLPEDEKNNSLSDKTAGSQDEHKDIRTSPRPDSSTNDSHFTMSSSSSSYGNRNAPNHTREDMLSSSATRSPLPRSFPTNYPYISAASAAFAAKPTKSRLHTGSAGPSAANRDRQIYLASLGAPSIITNPAEPTAEEELWIEEIIATVEAEKGVQTTQTFQRILPYVDGSHHLDEILYRSGLSRRSLRDLLAHYEGFLVSFIQ